MAQFFSYAILFIRFQGLWLLCSITCLGSRGETNANWPQFRGPASSGIAEGVPTPTIWNVPESRNLKWKTPIPGLGHSCPIVWGDRMFLTTAISDKKRDSLKIGIYH